MVEENIVYDWEASIKPFILNKYATDNIFNVYETVFFNFGPKIDFYYRANLK
jgi:hypothetical protein